MKHGNYFFRRTISSMSSMDRHKNIQQNKTLIEEDPVFKKHRLIEDEKTKFGTVS